MAFVIVLLFTAAGAVAALLALRVAPGSPVVRWLAGGFLLLAAANLGLHLWPAVAGDPAGAARGTAVALVLVLGVWGYGRLLRAARRAAARRDGE